MHRNISNLRQISSQCQAMRPLDANQMAWLGDCVSQFLSRESGSLDEAFGLCLGRGGLPWWVEEANRKRDQALRDLARSVCADGGPTARARIVKTLSHRYAASAWRHDLGHDAMPMHYRGTGKEYLWAAFKSGARMPLCERQLRNILV